MLTLHRAHEIRRRLQAPGPLEFYFGAGGDEVEFAFFSRLHVASETTKQTAPGRLNDLNAFLLAHLPRNRSLTVMDVGASSGITTAEWSEQLSDAGIAHQMIATDLVPEGVLLTAGRHLAVLWQPDGTPLAVQLGRLSAYLGLSAQTPRRRAITLVLARPLRAAARWASRRPHAEPEAPPSRWAIVIRKVKLVSRRLTRHPAAELLCDDLAVPGRFVSSVDVCRVANLLNRSYFSDAQLRVMLANAAARLRDGGLLVVSRTDASNRNAATVWQRTGDSLVVIERLHGGSEIEELVDAYAQSG